MRHPFGNREIILTFLLQAVYRHIFNFFKFECRLDQNNKIRKMDHEAKLYLITLLPLESRDLEKGGHLRLYIQRPRSAVREAITQDMGFELYFHTVACVVLSWENGLRLKTDEMTNTVY